MNVLERAVGEVMGDLTGGPQHPLCGQQAFNANGPSGVDSRRADANLCPCNTHTPKSPLTPVFFDGKTKKRCLGFYFDQLHKSPLCTFVSLTLILVESAVARVSGVEQEYSLSKAKVKHD